MRRTARPTVGEGEGEETRHLHHQNLTEKGGGVESGQEQIHEVVIPGVANATKTRDDTPTATTSQAEIGRKVRADGLIGDMMTGREADQVVEQMSTETVTCTALVVIRGNGTTIGILL